MELSALQCFVSESWHQQNASLYGNPRAAVASQITLTNFCLPFIMQHLLVLQHWLHVWTPDRRRFISLSIVTMMFGLTDWSDKQICLYLWVSGPYVGLGLKPTGVFAASSGSIRYCLIVPLEWTRPVSLVAAVMWPGVVRQTARRECHMLSRQNNEAHYVTRSEAPLDCHFLSRTPVMRCTWQKGYRDWEFSCRESDFEQCKRLSDCESSSCSWCYAVCNRSLC